MVVVGCYEVCAGVDKAGERLLHDKATGVLLRNTGVNTYSVEAEEHDTFFAVL
jgi:hypothetical protein